MWKEQNIPILLSCSGSCSDHDSDLESFLLNQFRIHFEIITEMWKEGNISVLLSCSGSCSDHDSDFESLSLNQFRLHFEIISEMWKEQKILSCCGACSYHENLLCMTGPHSYQPIIICLSDCSSKQLRLQFKAASCCISAPVLIWQPIPSILTVMGWLA